MKSNNSSFTLTLPGFSTSHTFSFLHDDELPNKSMCILQIEGIPHYYKSALVERFYRDESNVAVAETYAFKKLIASLNVSLDIRVEFINGFINYLEHNYCSDCILSLVAFMIYDLISK